MKSIYSRMNRVFVKRVDQPINAYRNHTVDLKPKEKVVADLYNVAQVVHDFPLKYTVKEGGTAKCTVRFQMSKVQEGLVRAHFGIKATDPLQFCTSEVVSTGNGWYTAQSTADKVDEAMKAVLNVKSALWHAANGVEPPKVILPPAMAELKDHTPRIIPVLFYRAAYAPKPPPAVIVSTKPVVRLIRKVIVHKRMDEKGRLMPVAIDRSEQATKYKESPEALTENIRHLMDKKSPPATKPVPAVVSESPKLVASVDALRSHFGKK